MKSLLLFLGFITHGIITSAEEVNMQDYIKLRNGMSEAEVLYLLGPYDHETIKSDRFDYILDKTWYYIPDKNSVSKWITELRFNSSGKLVERDRYKARD